MPFRRPCVDSRTRCTHWKNWSNSSSCQRVNEDKNLMFLLWKMKQLELSIYLLNLRMIMFIRKLNRITTWPIYRSSLCWNRNWTFWDLFDRVRSMMKTRQDNDMTNRTGAFYTKTTLNCCDWLDWVSSVIKTRHSNDVTDCIGEVYIKNDTKLSWSIGWGVDCDENQVGKLCD